MPKSSKQKLAYQAEYNARPENVNKREKNNAARQAALKAGTAKKFDGTNVDHIKMLDQGGTNAKQNLRVVPEAKNKGWRKDHPGVYGGGKGKR